MTSDLLFDSGMPRRIGALLLRHWYLISGSWPRILDLCYWPMVQMVLWGFIQTFLAQQTSFFARAGGILIGGVMLWDVLFRGQVALAISFLEEIYSRNLGHLLATPLTISEFMLSLMCASLLRTMIGLFPSSILAIWFFGFSIYSLGIALLLFFVSLIAFGWGIGLFVSGLVMRNGLGAENMAWALVLAIAPLCGVYYPTTILPEWVQAISATLPATYIFEGMRAVVIDQTIRWDLLGFAAVLNVIWLAAGMAAFLKFHGEARQRGMLLQVGE